jgi:RNA polymerase sigma-70 factor (ECF subfamily)
VDSDGEAAFRDESATPAERAERSEMHRRLWDAVAELEPRSCMAIELYYRQGLPLEEIAAALECPVGTVKTLLFRAREELRKALRDEPREVM